MTNIAITKQHHEPAPWSNNANSDWYVRRPDAQAVKRYATAFRPLPNSTPVSMADNKGCKWPIGEKPTLCCGLPSTTGRYCPDHERMSGKRLEPLA